MRSLFGCIAGVFLLLTCGDGFSSEGDPLAVRSWPGGTVSIESQWGLTLVLNPAGEGAEIPSTQTVSGRDTVDHILFRKPNAESASWLPAVDIHETIENSIHVKSLGHGGLSVALDGIRIMMSPVGGLAAIATDVESANDLDLLILDVKPDDDLSTQPTIAAIAKLQPQQILLNAISELPSPNTAAFLKAIGAKQLEGVGHNTIALSSNRGKSEEIRVLELSDQPWEMKGELLELFTAMDKSCRESQAVFSKLSAEQMNFKPSNGTHTPRWNTEHMMGRQLVFFSQIYNKLDPTIPVMNLNPKQMPPDYEFAHPDWDGAEEARQMQRVSDFTHRFAYLLADQDVNQKAPGSVWPTLGHLLKQMDRHYGEHTANTVKKFELPDWPKQ